IYNLSCIPSHTDPATGTSYDLVYYYNSSTGYYGTSGLLVGCGTVSSPGIVVVNPVDIDWARDGGGMAPDALAEVVVTIGLEGYKTVLQLLP
ncbi:MAG: hypothetical protein F7B20_07880, partial [Aeropyrum sp.]|nr:hypothetical protein [Aeropyrum sp.]